LIIVTSSVFSACTEQQDFSALEEESNLEGPKNLLEDPLAPIKILSAFPEDEMTLMGNTSLVNFGVILAATSGKADEFIYTLDSEVISEQEAAFFVYSGAKLTSGKHELVVTAKNKVSQDSHTFQLIRDEEPMVTSVSPDLLASGSEINCKDKSKKFSLVFNDPENAEMKFKWFQDGKEIVSPTDINNQTNASTYFKELDCVNAGSHVLSVEYSDGNNTNSYSYVYKLLDPDQNQPDAVEVTSFIPTADPVIMVNNQEKTFVINIKSGAGSNVVYKWLLDDVVVSTSPHDKNFVILDGAPLTPGAHSLRVQISNEVNEVSKTYKLIKNAPPLITAHTPDATGNTLDCTSGSENLNISVTDPDLTDTLTVEWLFNGASSPLFTSSATTGSPISTASAVFTPNCNFTGTHTLTAKVSDGNDIAVLNWSFTISNPELAAIVSYAPTSNPVVILSNGSQSFSVSATGIDETIKWQINGGDIPGETLSNYTIENGDLTPGAYTLKVIVTDDNSSDSHTWNVIQNVAPVLSSKSPAAAIKKLNVNNTVTFSVDGTDANSDTITYTWSLNSGSSPYLASSISGATSQAVFSPSDLILGTHTLKVLASDGRESVEESWEVEVNYFSAACNNLLPGQICTIAGPAGLGSGEPAESEKLKVRPEHIANDGSNNYFFSDFYTNVVYFYNASNSAVNRIGQTIQPGTVQIVLGNGSYNSVQTDGVQSLDYQIRGPSGIVYDAGDDSLFVSEFYRHRIVRVDTNGLVKIVLGTSAATNNASTNTDDTPGTNNVCGNPRDLAIDAANDTVFAACQQSDSVKYIYNANAADTSNILAKLGVGDQNGSGTTISGNGTTGDAGGGTSGSQLNGPIGLDIDADGNIYIINYDNCMIKFWNRTANPKTFFGSVTVNPNKADKIVGTGACSNSNLHLQYLHNAARIHRPYDISVKYNGSTVEGIFVAVRDYNRILFVNNSSSAVTYGNKTIVGYSSTAIVGTGTAEFGGDGSVGETSLIFNPVGLAMNNAQSTLFFADSNNFRVRTLDLVATDGRVNTAAGNGSWYQGYNGGNIMPANEVMLNSPMRGEIKNNVMYFSDRVNQRIRKLDLVKGQISVAVGEGGGQLNEGAPLTIRMDYPIGVAFGSNPDPADKINKTVFFADNYRYNGRNNYANQNCAIRLYNPNSSSISIFGKTLSSNYVGTVGGNYGVGCHAWEDGNFGASPTWDGADALDASFRAEAIEFINGEIYATDKWFNCIYKIDSFGVARKVLGQCTATAGNISNTLISNAEVSQPQGITADPEYMADGNFFFTDQSAAATSVIKYANQSLVPVTINNVTVAPDSVGTVFSVSSTRINDVAAFGNYVCASVGDADGRYSTHSVYCFDREAIAAPKTFGANLATVKSGMALNEEQEGISAINAVFFNPYGLMFDGIGNLYIIEEQGSKIRKIAKWWN